jgi:hypothetical protein
MQRWGHWYFQWSSQGRLRNIWAKTLHILWVSCKNTVEGCSRERQPTSQDICRSWRNNKDTSEATLSGDHCYYLIVNSLSLTIFLCTLSRVMFSITLQLKFCHSSSLLRPLSGYSQSIRSSWTLFFFLRYNMYTSFWGIPIHVHNVK